VIGSQGGVGGEVLGHPLAVSNRDEAVLPAVPERQRRSNVAHAEAPVVPERPVVIKPAPHAVRQGVGGLVDKVLRELSAQRPTVDVGDQIAEQSDDLVARGASEAAAITRSGSSAAHAIPWGPPPEPPNV
jgi:hypothetical protein